MSPEELDAIKQRANSATPGPWVFSEGTTIGGSIKGNGWRVDLTGHSYQAWSDVVFLAHSRTDIPLLLLEVERLRAEVERLTSPRLGFLTWLNEIADLLPAGTVIGVNVEELRRWFEAGMTVEGAALRLAQEGPGRVKETG